MMWSITCCVEYVPLFLGCPLSLGVGVTIGGRLTLGGAPGGGGGGVIIPLGVSSIGTGAECSGGGDSSPGSDVVTIMKS